MHPTAAPLVFTLGIAAALGATLLGGHAHGVHQLLLAGPVAVGAALGVGARTQREWWLVLCAVGAGALSGALLLALAH